MNFEFLEGLKGLDEAYRSCTLCVDGKSYSLKKDDIATGRFPDEMTRGVYAPEGSRVSQFSPSRTKSLYEFDNQKNE